MLNTVVKDTIVTAIKVGAPILIVVLVVGLVISIIQATTQIQEQTLTFVPKLIAIMIALMIIVVTGILDKPLYFLTSGLFDILTNIARAIIKILI